MSLVYYSALKKTEKQDRKNKRLYFSKRETKKKGSTYTIKQEKKLVHLV